MIVASISSQVARDLFNETFLEADYLADQDGNLREIIKAYETAHHYFQLIRNVDQERDRQIITDHQDCLQDLLEYYELYIKELINRRSIATAVEIQNKIDSCLLALDLFNDQTKAVSQARIDYLNQQNKMLRAARNWGFLCHDIPMDGNCLFHAIAHQLEMNHITIKKTANVELHLFLRSITVKHIAANALFYQERLTGISVHQYAQRMSNAGEWGDNIEIAALVRELNITLVLIENDENILIFKTDNSKPILYLGYERGVHFVSLQPMAGVPLNHELSQQLRIAPLVETKDIELQLPAAAPIISDQKPTPPIMPKKNGLTTSKFSFQGFLNFFKGGVKEEDNKLIPKTLRRS